MSGGIAYVLDEDGTLRGALQHAARRRSRRSSDDDVATVRALLEEHAQRTGSPVAARLLADWSSAAS